MVGSKEEQGLVPRQTVIVFCRGSPRGDGGSQEPRIPVTGQEMEYTLVQDDVCEKIIISFRFLLVAGAYWRKGHMGERHWAGQEGCCPCEQAPLIACVMGRTDCPPSVTYFYLPTALHFLLFSSCSTNLFVPPKQDPSPKVLQRGD